jgi:predicted N-acyltransferase
MRINSNARLSADAKAKWIAALPQTSAGAAGIDLCEALQDSVRSVSVCYLEVFSEDGSPLALALAHTIHDLDLGSYVGGVTQRIFTAIGSLGWRPLKMDVGFLEIPFCNLPGIFLTAEGERRESEVVGELIRLTRTNLPSDIFCVKTYDHKPSEQALAALGMMSTSFPANTCLQLPFSTFDDYLKSLSQEHRGLLRANKRKFAALNGRVTRVDDLEATLRITADLFHITEAFHHAKGDMGRPLEMSAEFLRCLNRNAAPGNRFLLVAHVNGEPAAVMLVLRSGTQLLAVKAGLNYELAKPSRAYFNLYYAMIEWAIENGIEFIQMSAEAYDLKRRIGGTTAPVAYYFDINNRWIAPVAKLASKHFSEQRGADVEARA